jgi:hypothetical protein
MAYIPKIQTPSVKPGLPRKPPATSTTYGTVNTIPDGGTEGNNQPGVPYGAYHRALTVVKGSERAGDFK